MKKRPAVNLAVTCFLAIISFESVGAAPPLPALLNPPRNAANVSLQPDFRWTQVVGVGSDSATNFNLQVSLDSTFNTLVWTTSNTSLTHYQFVTAILDPNTRYFWRVNGLNANAGSGDSTTASAWSDVWSFTTWGSCSNATLNGPWILKIPNSCNGQYLVFDGTGLVTECGGFKGSSGFDTVWNTCGFTIRFKNDLAASRVTINAFGLRGMLINDTSAIVQLADAAQVNWPMCKVTNPKACAGTWSGYFTDSMGANRRGVSVTVNDNGSVASFDPFGSPCKGRMFIEAGTMAGHVFTGGMSANSRWEEFGMAGTLNVLLSTCKELALGKRACSNLSRIDGVFNTDTIQTASRGSFYLQRTDPVPQLPPALNSTGLRITAHGISIDLEYPGLSTMRIYNTAGRLVSDLTPSLRRMHAGTNSIPAASTGLSRGLYIITFFNGVHEDSRSMVLLK